MNKRHNIAKVITKSAFSSHLVKLTVKCWRWMLLGCDWQISGGLDFEPYTAIISLHLNGKRRRSVAVLSYPPLLCKSCTEWRTAALPFVFMAFHSQDVSNGSRGHYLTRDWELSKGLLAFYTVYFFCTGGVCTRGKLADFAQTQMQLMEVTVRLAVSDEPAGCRAEEQFPLHSAKMSQQTQRCLWAVGWSVFAF